MPRKRPAPRHLPAPLPADRGRCPACWTMRPVDTTGKIRPHQVRERYEGQSPLVTCPGTGQQAAGMVVHAASEVRRF